MAEVRWTPQAAAALEAIADFIAGESPQFASLFVAVEILCVWHGARLFDPSRLA